MDFIKICRIQGLKGGIIINVNIAQAASRLYTP